jgi:hypothetical protein
MSGLIESGSPPAVLGRWNISSVGLAQNHVWSRYMILPDSLKDFSGWNAQAFAYEKNIRPGGEKSRQRR